MKRMASSYFQEIYTKDLTLDPGPILELLQGRVTDAMNEMLTKDFTDEEIGDALFQIGPLKAPGPDGIPARFYQRNWASMKEEIVPAVKEFFREGRMSDGVNETSIVLIPKISQPESLKDFRPISLCNVLYKIVSKCMVNRLRTILDEIISESQSAFVSGRSISNNATVAFKVMHYIQQERNRWQAVHISLIFQKHMTE